MKKNGHNSYGFASSLTACKMDMITLRNYTTVIHDMITCDLECPWHDYCII